MRLYILFNVHLSIIINTYVLVFDRVEFVVEGFMQLLLTEDNNGGVMTVTKQHGIQYHGRRRKLNKL